MRWKLGRHDRPLTMDFAPGMARDQADDTLDLRWIVDGAAIHTAITEPIEPQPAIGIDHDLNHAWIGERCGDRGTHRGAQHCAPAFS